MTYEKFKEYWNTLGQLKAENLAHAHGIRLFEVHCWETKLFFETRTEAT